LHHRARYRLEDEFGEFANNHLCEWVKGSSGDVLLSAGNTHGVDPGLYKREHEKDLPCDLALVTVRVLKDGKAELHRQVGHDEAEHGVSA
jgi:hypothetical protein